MSRPRQNGKTVGGLTQETTAARPSLLQPLRMGRYVCACLLRGIRDRQGGDELLVGGPIIVLKRLRYDAKYEIAYRCVQCSHQISRLSLWRRKNAARIDVVQAELTVRVEAAFHVLDQPRHDQLRNILLVDVLVAAEAIPSFVIEGAAFACPQFLLPIAQVRPSMREAPSHLASRNQTHVTAPIAFVGKQQIGGRLRLLIALRLGT